MPVPIVHVQKMKGACGSENHLLSLLSELDKRKFEPHYLILVEPGDTFPDYMEQLGRNGVHTLEMPIRGDFDPRLIVRLTRYFRRVKPRLVHTHLIHADLHGTAAAMLAGVPVRVSSRHNDDRFRTRAWIRWINRMVAGRQNRVVGISRWVSDFVRKVEEIDGSKVTTIHYGLSEACGDWKGESDPFEKLGIPRRRRVLVTLGRLTEQKGQIHLIRAMPKIIGRFPGVLLLMLGEGDLRPAYEAEIEKLGISDHVRLLGYVSPPDPILKSAEIFIHPSLWEGFGLVLLEAMSHEKPVVASRASAIPEIVADGETGLLVPPGDSDALAEAILRLLSHPEEARSMGARGRERLQSEFSVRKMVEETEALYRELLAGISAGS